MNECQVEPLIPWFWTLCIDGIDSAIHTTEKISHR
jgi:hypothetical protein